MAERLGITTAQLALRFCLETGTLPLPKSVTPERIRANLNVFSFALPADVIAEIQAFPEFGFSGQDPDLGQASQRQVMPMPDAPA